jgi:hypothetical protein
MSDIQFQQDRPDRHRPDRLLHRARRQGKRPGEARWRFPPAARDAGARPGTRNWAHSIRKCAGCGRDADLVIVSVPVGASGAVAKEISGAMKPGAIVTDVGSTKASVISQMAPYIQRGVHFIPGHPVAGTEHSGPDAGFADLFEGRWCILTPVADTDAGAIAGSGFWERSARASRRWTPSITTRCWRSSRICRISSPTTSSARPPISRR